MSEMTNQFLLANRDARNQDALQRRRLSFK
jgi:hypothetical protein